MPSLFGSKVLRGLRTPKNESQPLKPSPIPAPQGHDASQRKMARDLWSQAFESLPQSDREILCPDEEEGTPGDKASQLAAVGKIRELTVTRYEEYTRRGWQSKKSDKSRETNAKTEVRKIMCAALQFDDIVTAGLKLDPTGYGTIVWGVLSGVLTLVQNDKDRADAVFHSAAVLAGYLPKYAIIEDHYRDRQTQEQDAFEDQIRDVYTSILKYAVCVQQQLNLSLPGNPSPSSLSHDHCPNADRNRSDQD